jgi:hypothetical protein
MHRPSATESGTPRRTRSPRRYAVVALVACATGLAACGSSQRPAKTGSSGGPLLKYAQCMRAHGLSKFPDPAATGGLVIPNDINVQSPVFRSAQQACERFTQSSNSASASAARKLQLLAIAKCMRKRGVPDFSDPVSTPPPPSSGNAIGGNGWYLALGTAQQRQSPAYKHAAAGCQLAAR